MNLPLAVLMGLAGSSTAFLQSVRPTNFVVPAHKYNAAVSRARAVQPRAAVAGRNMRIMSAAVDTETDADTAEATSAVEIPVAVEDPISPALEVRKDDTQRHTHRETRVAESYIACARDQRCRSRACREVFAPFYFVPFFATCHVAPGVCVWLGYSEVCRAWRAHSRLQRKPRSSCLVEQALSVAGRCHPHDLRWSAAVLEVALCASAATVYLFGFFFRHTCFLSQTSQQGRRKQKPFLHMYLSTPATRTRRRVVSSPTVGLCLWCDGISLLLWLLCRLERVLSPEKTSQAHPDRTS